MTDTERKKPGPKKGWKKRKPPVNVRDKLEGQGIVIDDRPIVSPPKNKGGRPSLLTQEMQDRARLVVENVMNQGGSLLEVAFTLGITNDTVHRWVKENKEFSDTITRGKMAREIWFENQARNNVSNKEYNTGLFGLYAMNSVGWSRREKSETNLNVSNADMIREAAQKRIKKVERDEDDC